MRHSAAMPPEILSAARPTPLRLWGFLLTAAGVLVLGIGCVLDWAVLGFPGDVGGFLDVPVKGVDVWEGAVALGAGILALVGTLGLRLARGSDLRRALALGIVSLGALGMALAISVAMRADARFAGDQGLDEAVASLSEQLGISPGDARARLVDELDLAFDVELGPGVWLAAAGGLTVVIGGSISLAWARWTEGGAEPGSS